jgi:alkylation response protein AidB-like acyl-CoA dehydrogenase
VTIDFALTEEQEQLRDSMRAWLRDRYSFEQRRKAVRSPSSFRPEVWSAFANDLGILAMTFPERVGGSALDAVATMVVMEEFGRSLVLEPYLETVVICGGLLNRIGGARADRMLERIGAGEAVLAFAALESASRYDIANIATTARRDAGGWRLDGTKAVVAAAPWASYLLVCARTSGSRGERGGLSLFLVPCSAPGVKMNSYPTIDGRRAADVTFERVRIERDALIGEDGEAREAIERVIDEAIAALSAEAVGLMSQLHEETLEYAKQRRQFGQAIGRFQVLQHRLVDMHMEIELARSAAYLATLRLPAPAHERSRAASAAKVTINKACRMVGQHAVQIHGGMGMTDELVVSHAFRRATAIELELGTTDFHLARYASYQTANRSDHGHRVELAGTRVSQ